MELLFLGTSSGTPTKTRNVTGIALKEDQGKNWYLIDCGEATQHQLLHTSLSLNSLNGILITHVHGDHCYGLPGLLASAGVSGRKAPLSIVAPEGISEWINATCKYTQLYLPFELNFVAVETMNKMSLGAFEVDSLRLSHRVPSFAYRFSERKVETKLATENLLNLGIPKGPLWGKIKSGENIEYHGQFLLSSDFVTTKEQQQQIVICGDNDSPELLKDFCSRTDVLVHEATFTKDMAKQAGDVGHSYAKQVACFSSKVNIPNLVLTHFSARYQDSEDSKLSTQDICAEAKSVYHNNLIMAADFQRYRLQKDGKLVHLVTG